METESESLLCRLCLREYNKDQMVDIFAEERELDQAIYEAVSIKVHRFHTTTSICNNCQNIIELINCYKAACQKSDDLLKNGPIILESDAWSSLNQNDYFHQTAKLVEKHQQEIDILYRSHVKLEESECVTLSSEYILELVKEEKDVADADAEEAQDEVKDSDLGLHMVEDTTANDVIPNTQSLDDNPSNEESESGNETPRRRRGRKKSDNRKDKVVCSTCGELVSQQGLEGHLNRHLGVQPFPCNVEGCDAKLFSKFALQQHRSRHKSSNRFYDCKVCGKRIKGSAYWLIHRKIHEEEPRFSCDICGKKFRRKCKLKVHSTVHSGIAEYPCEICGKFFTVKHNLTAHYKLHMKNGTYPDGFEPSGDMKEERV